MTFFLRTYVLRKSPCKTPHFKKEIIIKEWKFSSSLMVISGIALISSQIDKIVASVYRGQNAILMSILVLSSIIMYIKSFSKN
jgi:O-antigen/teichoic acid export membrane protein